MAVWKKLKSGKVVPHKNKRNRGKPMVNLEQYENRSEFTVLPEHVDIPDEDDTLDPVDDKALFEFNSVSDKPGVHDFDTMVTLIYEKYSGMFLEPNIMVELIHKNFGVSLTVDEYLRMEDVTLKDYETDMLLTTRNAGIFYD